MVSKLINKKKNRDVFTAIVVVEEHYKIGRFRVRVSIQTRLYFNLVPPNLFGGKGLKARLVLLKLSLGNRLCTHPLPPNLFAFLSYKCPAPITLYSSIAPEFIRGTLAVTLIDIARTK